MKTFKNTGVMCMVTIADFSRDEGFKHVDLGNYFLDSNGNKCLITSKELANKYYKQINVPIYAYKEKTNEN